MSELQELLLLALVGGGKQTAAAANRRLRHLAGQGLRAPSYICLYRLVEMGCAEYEENAGHPLYWITPYGRTRLRAMEALRTEMRGVELL